MIQTAVLLSQGPGRDPRLFTETGSFPDQFLVIGNPERICRIPELRHAAMTRRTIGNLNVVEITGGMGAHNQNRIRSRVYDFPGCLPVRIGNVLNFRFLSCPMFGRMMGGWGPSRRKSLSDS